MRCFKYAVKGWFVAGKKSQSFSTSTDNTFLWCCLYKVVLTITLHKVVQPFESVDGILRCEHLNTNVRPVFSCGVVCKMIVDLRKF